MKRLSLNSLTKLHRQRLVEMKWNVIVWNVRISCVGAQLKSSPQGIRCPPATPRMLRGNTCKYCSQSRRSMITCKIYLRTNCSTLAYFRWLNMMYRVKSVVIPEFSVVICDTDLGYSPRKHQSHLNNWDCVDRVVSSASHCHLSPPRHEKASIRIDK